MSISNEISELSQQIVCDSNNASLYMQRGKLFRRMGDNQSALNDFIEVLRIEPQNTQAKAYMELINDIYEFHYREQLNV